LDPLYVAGGVCVKTDALSCKLCATLCEGELVGESRLLMSDADLAAKRKPTRNASVVADGDVLVLSISSADARSRISPEAMAAVRAVASSRLEVVQSQVSTLDALSALSSDPFVRLIQKAANEARHCT